MTNPESLATQGCSLYFIANMLFALLKMGQISRSEYETLIAHFAEYYNVMIL